MYVRRIIKRRGRRDTQRTQREVLDLRHHLPPGALAMSRFNHPLENVRVASPCNADWEQMVGNDRARFCAQCKLNVYNLSSMTREDAERLVGNTEGRLCIRYFRRADGSIITKNCPIGLRAVRRRMSYVARAIGSAVLSFMAGIGINQIKSSLTAEDQTMGVVAVEPVRLPVHERFSNEVVGEMAVEPVRDRFPEAMMGQAFVKESK